MHKHSLLLQEGEGEILSLWKYEQGDCSKVMKVNDETKLVSASEEQKFTTNILSVTTDGFIKSFQPHSKFRTELC